jgi:hypothetical protein
MTTDAKEVMTVPKKEQNAGVALLLERIKTNPEEFLEGGKWGALIHRFERYFSDEDAKALSNAIDELMQQKFTEKVLEELVLPKSVMNPYLAPSATLSAGTTLGLSSAVLNSGAVTGTITANAVSSTQLHELLHMKAQMELEKHKAKQVQKTLIGRLKNYLHDET